MRNMQQVRKSISLTKRLEMTDDNVAFQYYIILAYWYNYLVIGQEVETLNIFIIQGHSFIGTTTTATSGHAYKSYLDDKSTFYSLFQYIFDHSIT